MTALHELPPAFLRGNQALAGAILQGWHLPAAERAALAALVLALAPLQIFPLAPVGSPVAVSPDGAFLTRFRLGAKPDARQFADLRRLVEKSGVWRLRAGEGLHLASKRRFAGLTHKQPVTTVHLQAMGLDALPADPVLAACCRGLAYYGGQPGQAPRFRDMTVLTAAITQGSSVPAAQRLVKFVDDRKGLARLAGLGLTDTGVTAVENAITAILPKLQRVIGETVNKTPAALGALKRFFADDTDATVANVAGQLQKASDFLSTPRRSKITSALTADEAIYNMMKQRTSTVAFEYGGKIYIFEARLAAYPPSELGWTLLHESLHLYIDENHQRPDGRDPGYRHEQHFTSLPTAAALENPDSYVAFVQQV